MNTPTINVNLKPCRCQESKKRAAPCELGHHRPECGGPVPIPCPIPRSVTFHVALGGCECPTQLERSLGAHHHDCPARPVKVSCSISGETWEESEVESAEEAREHYLINDEVFDICIARWALVKALVLGQQPGETWCINVDLFEQRDAVFAALCYMANAEEGLCSAANAVAVAMGATADGAGMREAVTHSRDFMAAYLDRLIEQVGILSGGQ